MINNIKKHTKNYIYNLDTNIGVTDRKALVVYDSIDNERINNSFINLGKSQ